MIGEFNMEEKLLCQKNIALDVNEFNFHFAERERKNGRHFSHVE